MCERWQDRTQFFDRLLSPIFAPKRKTCVDNNNAPNDDRQHVFALQQCDESNDEQNWGGRMEQVMEQPLPDWLFFLLREDVLPVKGETRFCLRVGQSRSGCLKRLEDLRNAQAEDRSGHTDAGESLGSNPVSTHETLRDSLWQDQKSFPTGAVSFGAPPTLGSG